MSTSVEIEMVIQLPNSEPELITFNSEHVISAKLIDEIGRMIGAWINKLKEQGLFS